MKLALPPAFVERRLKNLEIWLRGFSASANVAPFVERSRAAMRSLWAAEKLLAGLPGLLAGNHESHRLYENILLGPAQLLMEPRKITRHASKKLPKCDVLNIENLVAVHVVGALLCGNDKNRWARARATLQGISAAALELHWQVHVEAGWNNLDGGSQNDLLNRFSRTSRQIGEPPQFNGAFDCRWFREPVIEQLLDLGDAIARGTANIPKCLDGTYSNDAIDQVDPRVACEGQIVRLIGNFPAAQDAAVNVLFPTAGGYQPAQVVSWSASAIEVRVPASATPGCIWFEDDRLRQEYQRCLLEERTAVLEGGTIQKGSALSSLSVIGNLIKSWLNAPQTRVEDLLCASHFDSFYAGSIVEVRDLSVNGTAAWRTSGWPGGGGTPTPVTIDVWSGRPVQVAFTAIAAEHLHLCAYTADFSYGLHVELNPTDKSYTFTPAVAGGTELIIKVFGWNRCSEQLVLLAPLNPADPCTAAFDTSGIIPVVASSEAHLRIRTRPQLRVIGVEATQAVQHFSVADPNRSTNNSIELIRRRTTALRVYVESGLAGTATTHVSITGRLEFDAGPTIYPWGSAVALPQAAIDREQTNHAITFVVPGALPLWAACTQGKV